MNVSDVAESPRQNRNIGRGDTGNPDLASMHAYMRASPVH